MITYYLSAIGILFLINLFLRYFPFLFPRKITCHPHMMALGSYLPPAIMFALVLYCFASEYKTTAQILPFLLSSLLVLVLHVIKRQVLLSVTMGTVVYCLLANTNLI